MGQNVNYPLTIFKSSKTSLTLIELQVNVGKTKVIDKVVDRSVEYLSNWPCNMYVPVGVNNNSTCQNKELKTGQK